MVAFLLALLTSTGMPLSWEVPESVEPGTTFSLTITSTAPGAGGISTGPLNLSPGLSFRGSSTSTSISSVTTPAGRQLTQVMVCSIVIEAAEGGEQWIGPFTVELMGIGTYTIDRIAVTVTGEPPGTAPSRSEPVWLKGILRDPGGRIYPGTRLVLDYYVYATVSVQNVTYWWGAPELGVTLSVETISESNWTGTGRSDNSSRSRLAVLEMIPAAPGTLSAPPFFADITGTGFDTWGKAHVWTVESEPVLLPVYPLPPDPPNGWDGTIQDSISVSLTGLPSPLGQGGEVAFRLTCMGPGIEYMEDHPSVSGSFSGTIMNADRGSAPNKKWWDYILVPDETGVHVVGPDTLVWLDRSEGRYRLAVSEPCTLSVPVIPRSHREIDLPSLHHGPSTMLILCLVGAGLLLLTITLGLSARKRDRRMASIATAADLDELLTGLENDLSTLLTGKREYMGFEELSDYLNRCDTDSLLARRVLRFWKDLETSLSDTEFTDEALKRLKATACELLRELEADLSEKD